MTPDDPRHGSEAGYSAHHRTGVPTCTPCHKAKLRGDKRRRVIGPALKPLPEDVRELVARVGVRSLATRTGVSATAIHNLKRRGDEARAYPKTIARLREARFPTDTGTVRRIRALSCLGWSAPEIAAAAGEPVSTIVRLRDHDARQVIGRDTLRDGVARAYERLSMRRAPLTKWSSRVTNNAIRQGWSPPLAWDDIDDPGERPHGHRTPSNDTDYDSNHIIDEATVLRVLAGETLHANRAERLEIMRRWLKAGNSAASICKRLGWNDGRYVTREDGAA